METTTEVAKRVGEDIEDVLATLPLVRATETLTDRLFSQLVDLLLESTLVELRQLLDEGALTGAEYAAQLAELAGQCRAVGLVGHT
jgi:hypothetical protein